MLNFSNFVNLSPKLNRVMALFIARYLLFFFLTKVMFGRYRYHRRTDSKQNEVVDFLRYLAMLERFDVTAKKEAEELNQSLEENAEFSIEKAKELKFQFFLDPFTNSFARNNVTFVPKNDVNEYLWLKTGNLYF